MLDFHSEIPAQVALSGILGPFSRKAPIQLTAALAASADTIDAPGPNLSPLPSAIRSYVTQLRDRGVPPERVLAILKGLLDEIAPDLHESEQGRSLAANVIRWGMASYYLSGVTGTSDVRQEAPASG